MGFDVGTVVTGTVSGIKKFGAFVTLGQGVSGLVHISEVANTYVDDVADHLSEGQQVKVKIIGVDQSGRINLSIKKALEPERTSPPPRAPRQYTAASSASGDRRGPPQEGGAKAPNSFEDKLKQFMQDSSNKMSGLEMYSAKKSSRRKSKG